MDKQGVIIVSPATTSYSVEKMDRLFYPRSVAVIGDKRENNFMWLKSLSKFKGELYSVQIDPSQISGIEALGVRNFHSIMDIPGPVDFAVIAVPSKVTPRILDDCIKKGVVGASMFTSGFAETGTDDGKRLQGIIAEKAKSAGFLLIGPNCMGIFNPTSGVRHHTDQYILDGDGEVGFISQSGTHAGFFSLVGYNNGIEVNKSVSYGNAAVLDSVDFLEYFAADEKIKVIAMYIEGVKDGRRFYNSLKRITQLKPVVIWKGGSTVEGTRATSSHTGSITHSQVAWKTLVQQSGAIEVDNFDELIDVVRALLRLKMPEGDRMGLIAMTGGQSVIITDSFVRAGLKVPLLSRNSYQELGSFFNLTGGSYINPLDVAWNVPTPEHVIRLLNILCNDPNIDCTVLELSIPLLSRRWRFTEYSVASLLEALEEFQGSSPKPFFMVLTQAHMEEEGIEVKKMAVERDLVTFPSFHRGANAFSKIVRYFRQVKAQD